MTKKNAFHSHFVCVRANMLTRQTCTGTQINLPLIRAWLSDFTPSVFTSSSEQKLRLCSCAKTTKWSQTQVTLRFCWEENTKCFPVNHVRRLRVFLNTASSSVRCEGETQIKIWLWGFVGITLYTARFVSAAFRLFRNASWFPSRRRPAWKPDSYEAEAVEAAVYSDNVTDLNMVTFVAIFQTTPSWHRPEQVRMAR